ncbi:MAG: glycoside hydrolase family 97 catalytic domain-containing protein [Bacteroidales bacterium]|nr:glycoside hydrolase family 97 catalytic domain-containing protein [Bacteroidales bacterium]
MKTRFLSAMIALAFIVIASSCSQSTSKEVSSPSGNIKVVVEQNPATKGLSYKVLSVNNGTATEAIQSSPLGIVYDNEDFSSNLTLKGFSESSLVKDSYTLIAGKQSQVEASCNEFTVTAVNPNQKEIQVRFRVYDDGVAFQYVLQGNETVTIKSEATGFSIPMGGKGWMHPYDKVTDWSPGYETPYENGIAVGTNAPADRNGWAFPLVFNTNNLWILVTEAGGEAFKYGGTHLQPNCENGLYTIRFAEADEARGLCSNEPQVQLPFSTNWRVIACGSTPSTIVETNLTQTLNAATPYTDLSWIKPGVAAWSWWSTPDSPKDFNLMVPFIDMASELGWPYFLVDANWNIMKNGDLKKVCDYAAKKNVGILVWYNSGGTNNVVTEMPRNIMCDSEKRKKEMKWMQEIGVKGIKVDFFQSDKPCIMQQYEDILKDAMDAHILVNFHGCTLPKGWERTYPNLMTMEAIIGEENYAFQSAYPAIAPVLNTIIPFGRNAVGPIDYTPTTFTNHKFPRLTTVAHELALSILFQSGIVHIADHVKGIEAAPDYVKKFLSEIPAAWDETKYVTGTPGKEVVLARRKGNIWYVAGINGENNTKEITFDASFLSNGTTMNLISDGTNQQEFAWDSKQQSETPKITVKTLPYGGFVATFVK